MKLSINIEKILKMEGLVNIYLTDIHNIARYANQLQMDFTRDILKLKPSEVIGRSVIELFSPYPSAAEVIYQENEKVLASGIPKQFYSTCTVQNLYTVEMLTIKTPMYDEKNKLWGILGISQYLNKFSRTKAIVFGLTPREIDCLIALLDGKKTKIIAQELNISPRTVESHLDSLKLKFACSSKTELILHALQAKFKEGIKDTLEFPHKNLTFGKKIN